LVFACVIDRRLIRYFLCCSFRNEAPYLREWIEYHRLIGFETFLLMNDNSTDDTQCLLDAYAEEGIVIRVPNDIDEEAVRDLHEQDAVFDVCTKYLQSNPTRFDPSRTWMMTHDTDEFVWFDKTDSVQSFGDAMGNLIRKHGTHVKSLLVPRFIVGSSGHDYYDAGLVIDRFTHRFNLNSCPGRARKNRFSSHLSKGHHFRDNNKSHRRRRLFHQRNPISYCRARQRSDSYDLEKSISHASSLAQDCTKRVNKKVVPTYCSTTHRHTLVNERKGDNRFLHSDIVGKTIVIMHYMTKSR